MNSFVIASVLSTEDIYVPIKTSPHLSVFVIDLIAIVNSTLWNLQDKFPQAPILTDILCKPRTSDPQKLTQTEQILCFPCQTRSNLKTEQQKLDTLQRLHTQKRGRGRNHQTCYGHRHCRQDPTCKAEVYSIINDIMMEQSNFYVTLIPTTLKKHVGVSSNLPLYDIVYTRLRQGHNVLKANLKLDTQESSCRRCGNQSL